MKIGSKIVIVLGIIVLIALPVTFLIYKNAYEQLEINSDEIIIDNVSSGINGYGIDLRLNLTITSPTGIPLSVDGGNYKVEIDDVKVGDGTFGPFTARKEPSNFITEINLTIGLNTWQSITNLVLGNDVTIKITILDVRMLGINIPINKVQEKKINLQDYL